MEKITALIVDDEKRARRVIRNLLDRHTIYFEIIGECSNVEEAVISIQKYQPQVVFLDVQMPNYDGYELVNFFDSINFEIIFVTAFDHYAIKAFEVCAIDYLVKPIDRERLDDALERLRLKLDSKDKLIQYQTLLETVTKRKVNKLVIPELGNRRVINLEEILAIEADGAYTKIYLKNKHLITTSKNLKHYQNLLAESPQFFRSHRSWIINIDYLEKFNRTENFLQLKEKIIAKISRSNYRQFDLLLESK